MKKEDIDPFLGKKVKLVKANGFVLFGYIKENNEDNIVFDSDQARSLIHHENIREIIFSKNGGGKNERF